MAENFSAIARPANHRITRRFTTAVAPNELTEVILPTWCRTIVVQFRTNDGILAMEGTDAAALGAHYEDVLADASYAVPLTAGRARNRDGMSVFVTSANATTACSVTMEY